MTAERAVVLSGLDTISADLVDLYCDLHAHPELSFAEHRTAGVIAARTRAAGYEVTEGVGSTGVVVQLRNGNGPTVLLRADTDVLPVAEATGLPYASTQRGRDPDGTDVPVMHACGHDMHITWLIGALDLLSRSRAAWSGTVLAVFQPAEELGTGAQRMVDDGLLTRFGRPDIALGQHVVPLSAGVVGYRPGAVMAGFDELGADRVTVVPPVMSSEDFGVFGTAAGVPSCFWFLGGTDPAVYAAAQAAGRLDQDVPSNHSPVYAPVIEPTLTSGVRAMVAAALTWLAVPPAAFSGPPHR